MIARRELPSILTRAMLTAASAAEQMAEPSASRDLFPVAPPRTAGGRDSEAVSGAAHQLMAGLITLLMLELDGLVESPLNRKSRVRLRLGAPSRSRILAEWTGSLPRTEEANLFAAPQRPPALPSARDPEAFFETIIDAARASANYLGLTAATIEELIRWLLPVIARCGPEDDPVGWIHAHGQRHRLVRGPGSRLRFQVDRERGRSQGVLYTPPPLTDALVDAVLNAWSESSRGGSIPLFGAETADRPPMPRILDPSCGSGQFLLAIARRLINDGPAKPAEVLEVFTSMHGVDIDPAAATLAAFNLSLLAVRSLCRSQGADPAVVVGWLEEQLGHGFPWFLGTQIHQGNALFLAPTLEGMTFRWTDRFAPIFERERPGFDIVIGNPPWVSYGLRDRAGAEAEEESYLRRLYSFGAQYKLSLYPLFIELALRLTRPAGLHGFLVPDSFFTGRHFSKIRAHLLQTSRPLLFCLVESGPWPGVHVGHTGFYCVRRLPAPGAAAPVTTSVLQLSAARHRPEAGSGQTLFSGRGDRTEPVLVDPHVFDKTPHQAFRIYRDPADHRLVEAMDATPLRIENLVDTYSGLIGRYGQESITGPTKGDFVLHDRAMKIVLRDPDPATRWRPALHSGAEVEPFRVRWRGGCVYVPDNREIRRRVYKSGFDIERYLRPKLFLRQTGDRIVAAREDQGLFCLNNVHILTPCSGPEVDLRFLLGLLMSGPMQRYYQIVALETGRPLAQVDLATIRTLPFPCDPDGSPHGLAVQTPRGARAAISRFHQRIEQSVALGRLEDLFRIVRDGKNGSGEEWDSISERDRTTLAIGHIVGILERSDGSARAAAAHRALDRLIGVLFGLEVPARS
jgi:methylase of polypeptide subunit release factors